MIKESDFQRIRSAIETLAEVFHRSLTDTALDLYVQAVGDLEVAALDTAISAAAAGSMHFPCPAEIRELAGAATPTAQDRAALAFQALREAISRIGGFRSPDFEDALINAVVRNLGGWQRACEMPLSQYYGNYREDFMCIYEMFCRLGPSDEMTAPLVG